MLLDPPILAGYSIAVSSEDGGVKQHYTHTTALESDAKVQRWTGPLWIGKRVKNEVYILVEGIKPNVCQAYKFIDFLV